ncbi:MAG: 4'-phosphopantetheinyl transferase superfamily protein [Clostridiales Family XIII bacterium]|jgi:4'-phosphopantetheinyl transferase|nr:4'-phosphopantetheinyl transferase superfamily protein [Clostridiales Family XIII bacterium]
MYLYLRESDEKTDEQGFFRAAFLDYNARAGLGLSRREAETAPCAAGPYGKPYFVDIPRVRFSISHSGRLIACLMAGVEVGLDAEDLAMRREQDARRAAGAPPDCARYLKIARRHFRADELRFVEEAEERGYESLLRRFFFVWTRKEAYVKYTGRGLGAGLGTFSVLGGELGVSFGAARAGSDFEISYCHARLAEAPAIREIFRL